jgi:hypothetical protein
MGWYRWVEQGNEARLWHGQAGAAMWVLITSSSCLQLAVDSYTTYKSRSTTPYAADQHPKNIFHDGMHLHTDNGWNYMLTVR